MAHTVEHVDATDPEIHEPKGASAAGLNTGYVANGGGSGVWAKTKMVDIDTQAATVNQVFAADGSGGVNIVNVADIVQISFGEIGLSGNATATVISVADTFVPIEGTWSLDHANNFTSADSNRKLVAPADGTYRIDTSISFEGSSGVTWQFDVAVNTDTNVSGHKARRKTGNNDVGNCSLVGFHVLSAGDEVYVVVKDEATTANPTITDCNFTLSLIKAV